MLRVIASLFTAALFLWGSLAAEEALFLATASDTERATVAAAVAAQAAQHEVAETVQVEVQSQSQFDLAAWRAPQHATALRVVAARPAPYHANRRPDPYLDGIHRPPSAGLA